MGEGSRRGDAILYQAYYSTSTLKQKYHRCGTSLVLYRVVSCSTQNIAVLRIQYFVQIYWINSTFWRTEGGINSIIQRTQIR